MKYLQQGKSLKSFFSRTRMVQALISKHSQIVQCWFIHQNSFFHNNIYIIYLYMKLYFRVTKFRVMSPLTFTISAITQPVVQGADYQVTMSLESDANNVIGSHVVCFSSELSTRQVEDFCNTLLAINHLYQPLNLYILILTRWGFLISYSLSLPHIFKRVPLRFLSIWNAYKINVFFVQ